MGSTPITENATRRDAWTIPPEELVIKGFDDKDVQHVLCRAESNEKEVDAALIDNVALLGVLQPVSVRNEDGQILVVAGRHRTRALREVNKRIREWNKAHKGEVKTEFKVEVTLRKPNEDAGRQLEVVVSENLHRRTNDVLEKAKIAAALYHDHKKSKEEVAATLGLSINTVESYIALDGAVPEVRDAVVKGDMSPSAAANLARSVPRAEQAIVTNRLVENAKAKAAEKSANKKAAPPKKGAPPKKEKAPKVSLRDTRDVTSKGGKKGFKKPSPKTIKAVLKDPKVDVPSDERVVVLFMLGEGPPPSWWPKGRG